MARDKSTTQKRIAELAGVSQSTVSLVLNGTSEALRRIPVETQQRVREIIRETTYVANPAARRLVGVGNSIIGVFTYEPAFPNESLDFYTPLLTGIESRAEELGCDLLMFTSAPVVEGRRRLFHEDNRLRLADGCLLLGREMDEEELGRLVRMDFPFVAIGRRNTEGVPYVAADYVSQTGELVRRAYSLGHRRFLYIHLDSTAESVADRKRGFTEGIASRAAAEGKTVSIADVTEPLSESVIDEAWSAVVDEQPSVLFVEYPNHATQLRRRALDAGMAVPGDLSIVVLAEALRGEDRADDFTRMVTPRGELGAEALGLLDRILKAREALSPSDLRVSVGCRIVDGSTLGPPNKS